MHRDRRDPAGRRSGFTLVELALAVGIALVLAAIALPAYRGYVERARVKRAVAEIRSLTDHIGAYELEHRIYPADLDALGIRTPVDPWGHPYQYLRIAGPSPPPIGLLRKDKNLVPLNTDYDLYSVGADGSSQLPLTAQPSRDDVVRANDGGFVGLATEY